MNKLSKAFVCFLMVLSCSSFAQSIGGHNAYAPWWQVRNVDSLDLKIEFDSWYGGEVIHFSAENNVRRRVCLPNSAPWSIVDNVGNFVFQPVSLQAITCIAPGSKLQWTWNQLDDDGRRVARGEYRIQFQKSVNTLSFNILGLEGSDGHFTFRVGQQSTKIFISRPHEVRKAIENFYGLNLNNIPAGTVVDDRPGRSPFDEQWSWHLDPASVTMVEVAIELCDGTPGYIEENLDDWLVQVGSWCPWTAQIISLN